VNHRAAALGPRDPAPAKGSMLRTLALIGLGGAAAYLIWPWRSRQDPEGAGSAADPAATCACGRPLPIPISASVGTGDESAPPR